MTILFAPSIRWISTPKQQRGAATLVVSLILLFGMTLIAFFVNRSMLFEQKTSANQLRSTRAFETAEAGIEWATSMLNDIRTINASCTNTGTTNTESFRQKYVPYNSGFAPVSTVQPGCSISSSNTASPTLSCGCPSVAAAAAAAAGTTPYLAATSNPTFTVKFDPNILPDGTTSTDSVLLTSYGCTATDGRCVPGGTNTADAYQKISIILKLRPAIASFPAAAITTGGSLQLTSAASSVSNTDLASNGVLVNSGGGINTTSVAGCNGALKDFATAATLPGTPWPSAMLANDTSLSALSANPDAMFASFFGTTLAQFQSSTSTKNLTSCGSVVNDFTTAFNQGFRSFYTTCDFQTNNDMGTTQNPIIFVTTGELRINGGADVYGMVYVDRANFDAQGLGNASINGALIVRGDYCANANADYNYDADVLSKLGAGSGSLIRIPGSWKDF